MKAYQKQFIELAIEHQVLKFGEFTLKSGRISPYFFNAGLFFSGKALSQLGHCYSEVILQAITEGTLAVDVLFGPAYKGIPLVSATAVAMAQQSVDMPYAYNRKEKKNHGEGGVIVGASVRDKKVLIIDDVITAGTAIREVIGLLQAEGATPAGVLIGLDRMEKGSGELSAIQELSAEYAIPVLSIISLSDIVHFLDKAEGDSALFQRVMDYKEQYGVK